MRRARLHVVARGSGYTTRVNARDAAGNRVQRRFSGETEAQVEAQAYAWLAQMAGGTWRRSDDTPLMTWMQLWYQGYRPPSPATKDERLVQMARIERHAIARLPLGKLSHQDIQAFVDWLMAERYAPGTIRNTLAVLSMALDAAVRRGLIQSNPSNHVVMPANAQHEWVILNQRQVRTLIEGTRGERLHAFWVLAVMLGLRRGELLALGWDAVDLERGELVVRRHLSRRQGRYQVVAGAKTTSGRRQLVLPEPCIDALMDEQRTQAARCVSAWVFDDGLGQPFTKPGALWWVWRDVTTRLGLPQCPIHDLRHTFATHALYSGLPLPEVSRILGHANVGITARIYSHAIDRMSQATAAKIGEMYG